MNNQVNNELINALQYDALLESYASDEDVKLTLTRFWEEYITCAYSVGDVIQFGKDINIELDRTAAQEIVTTVNAQVKRTNEVNKHTILEAIREWHKKNVVVNIPKLIEGTVLTGLLLVKLNDKNPKKVDHAALFRPLVTWDSTGELYKTSPIYGDLVLASDYKYGAQYFTRDQKSVFYTGMVDINEACSRGSYESLRDVMLSIQRTGKYSTH